VEHPGLRQLLEGLLRLHDRGVAQPDPASAYDKVRARFREKLEAQRTQDLKTQVLAAQDHGAAVAVLAKLRAKPDTVEN